MKKIPFGLISGIALLLVTLLLMFVGYQDTSLDTMHYLALGGILLAEVICTAYASYIGRGPRHLTATFISLLMIPYALLLALLYINIFSDSYLSYTCLYLVGIVIINTVTFIMLGFGANRNEENNRVQKAKNTVTEMRSLVKYIMSDPAAQPYQARLRALEEDLHFSNDAVSYNGDGEIHQMLLQLNSNIGNANFDVSTHLTSLEKAVKLRKALCANRHS